MHSSRLLEDIQQIREVAAKAENNLRPRMEFSLDAWDRWGRELNLPLCIKCEYPKVMDEACFVCANPESRIVIVPERKFIISNKTVPAQMPPMNRQQRRRLKALQGRR